MKDEIERKFLIDLNGLFLSCFDKENISQGYIMKNPETRIRKTNDEYIYTIKGIGDLSRPEENIPVTKILGEYYFTKIISNILDKTRYQVVLDDDFTGELDIYNGYFKGLIIIEVEFKNEKESEDFYVPSWFGPEVTYDKRFKNGSLAYLDEMEAKSLVSDARQMLRNEKIKRMELIWWKK